MDINQKRELKKLQFQKQEKERELKEINIFDEVSLSKRNLLITEINLLTLQIERIKRGFTKKGVIEEYRTIHLKK